LEGELETAKIFGREGRVMEFDIKTLVGGQGEMAVSEISKI